MHPFIDPAVVSYGGPLHFRRPLVISLSAHEYFASIAPSAGWFQSNCPVALAVLLKRTIRLETFFWGTKSPPIFSILVQKKNVRLLIGRWIDPPFLLPIHRFEWGAAAYIVILAVMIEMMLLMSKSSSGSIMRRCYRDYTHPPPKDGGCSRATEPNVN